METVGEKKKAERRKFTVISKNQKKVNRNESSSWNKKLLNKILKSSTLQFAID